MSEIELPRGKSIYEIHHDCHELLAVKEAQLKIAIEALGYIAPMEQDEEFPVTRISKAAKRARQALEQIKKGKLE